MSASEAALLEEQKESIHVGALAKVKTEREVRVWRQRGDQSRGSSTKR
jgi:hypothetical protein